MQFAPRAGPGFPSQTFLWMISIYTYYVIFFTDSMIGDYNCLIIIVFSYIARAAPIAGKYGTYPRNKIEHLKKNKLTIKEIMLELMLVGWLVQKPEVIAIEIDASMKRNEIDDTIFMLSFMSSVRSTTEQKLIEISKKHKQYYETHKTKDFRRCVQSGKEIVYYDAKLIFEYMIREFNANDKTKASWKLMLIVIFSVSYGLSPGIFRAVIGQTFHGEGALSISAFYLNALSSTFLIFTAFMFYTGARLDMKRRSYILRQLGQMISPKKNLSYQNEKKLFPTLNLTDQLSLNTWLDLRKMSVDYGRKYFFRHEIFFPVVFFMGLVSFIAAFVLLIFEFDVEQKLWDEIVKMRMFLSLNTTLMFFLFFGLLYQGSGINMEFEEHIKILRKNKQLYNDLVFFKEYYFGEHINGTEQVKKPVCDSTSII